MTYLTWHKPEWNKAQTGHIKCKHVTDQGIWPAKFIGPTGFQNLTSGLTSMTKFCVHHEKMPFVKFQNKSINMLPRSLAKPFLIVALWGYYWLSWPSTWISDLILTAPPWHASQPEILFYVAKFKAIIFKILGHHWLNFVHKPDLMGVKCSIWLSIQHLMHVIKHVLLVVAQSWSMPGVHGWHWHIYTSF